jgi:hypothetical protein
MAQDKEGNMCFTMKNRISKFDGKTFTEYTSKEGLGGNELITQEIWGAGSGLFRFNDTRFYQVKQIGPL